MLQMLALGAAGAALLPSITACSPQRKPDGRISFATGNDGVWLPRIQEAAREFEAANPGTKVDVMPLPSGALDAWLVARTAAGQAPDIVELGVSAVSRYSRNGTAVDISDYLDEDVNAAYLPALAALLARDGQVFGLPKLTTCLTMYYRTEIVEQIGCRIPTSPEDGWTWDEFREYCVEAKKITGQYGTSYGYVNANSGNRWLPALYQRGGALFDEDGQPSMISEEALDALEWSRRFYSEGLMSLSNTVKASQADTAASLFATGQTGFMVHESQSAVLRELMPDDAWGATYLFTDQQPATTLSGSVNIVTSSSPDPELATRFLQFATNRERTAAAVGEGGWISPYRDAVETGIEYSYRPEAAAVSIEQFASVPEIVGVDMSTRDYQTVREVLGDALDLLFIGSASVRETAERINAGVASA